MEAQTLLLVVEGPHDQAVCARLLRLQGFKAIHDLQRLKDLHAPWDQLVPKTWPAKGADLLTRHPVPLFLGSNSGHSVAIQSAIGDSALVKKLASSLAILPGMPSAVGMVVDADTMEVAKRQKSLLESIRKHEDRATSGLDFPSQPGIVGGVAPRLGMFVLPDNIASGTLEDLLLEAGSIPYPGLRSEAEAFVSLARGLGELTPADLAEIGKPAGEKKAVVSAMSSILRPGKAIQVSLEDNRWFDAPSLSLPRVAALSQFLGDLLAITP